MSKNTTLPNTVEAWEKYYEDCFLNPLLDAKDIVNRYNAFISFIVQPLHPSMFIPWDMENNCPMEKPIKEDMTYYQRLREYQQAQEKVIFKGFTDYGDCFASSKIAIQYHDGNIKYHDGKFIYGSRIIKTIQDLCNKVDVTDEKFKELKL